jgi:hypothetical protein
MPATKTRKKKKLARADAPKHARNADAIKDHVINWMHNNCPELTIDKLLTEPLSAIRMGITVAGNMGTISREQAIATIAAMETFHRSHKASLGFAADVCHAAMNLRKKGDIKQDMY